MGFRTVGSLIAVSFIALASAGCNPVATVSYRQFGACGTGNKAFVFFSFVALDNSSGVTTATFDPYASFVQGHQNDGNGLGYVDLGTTGQLAVNLGFPAAAVASAAPGGVTPLSTIGVAPLTTTGDAAQEANNTPYFLDVSGALGDKLNSSQTSWPVTPSCQDVNIKNAH